MFLPLPFSSKQLPDGKKLFRRVHGFKMQLVASGNATYDFLIPYDECKINEAEIIGCPEGVTCDFKVLDTPSGLLTTVPNYALNQFAFDINVAKDYYKDHSPYDADLIKDMQIRVILKNSTASTAWVGVNIVIHEVKV